MKKIYFSGSIRGGRAGQKLYASLIEFMKQTDIVLTEHIGYENPYSPITDEEIYNRDINWLKECDLVIAECSTPSLGVGYELAYAEKLSKPVYILCRKDVGLSAMLTGDPYFQVYYYQDEKELYPYLESILKSA